MESASVHIKHTPLVEPTQAVMIPHLNGLVLAGGESNRMGRDKTLLEYHGIPQRDFMLHLLNGFVSRTFLSCHPARIPDTSHPVITDTFLDLGPYGGVLSAFRFDPNSAWLAVACDLPLLDKETISILLDQRDPLKMATCFHDPSTSLPEPMIAIWEPRAYPILLQFLGQGLSCLRKVLFNSDSKQIDPLRIETLRNANTPEESESLQKLIHGSITT